MCNKCVFATHFSFTVSSLKMCTVSVLLDAERNMLSMLKAREQMLTHLGASGRGGVTLLPTAPGAHELQPLSRDFFFFFF